MNQAEFARIFCERPESFAWFLGAGASRNANLPTAEDIITDLKRRYYCSEENQSFSTKDLQNDADRADEDLDPETLMDEAEGKYNALETEGAYVVKDPRDAQIVALQARINKLEHKQKTAASKKRKGGGFSKNDPDKPRPKKKARRTAEFTSCGRPVCQRFYFQGQSFL